MPFDYRKARRRLIRAWGNRCRICGEKRKRRLQFAHLKPTGVRGRGRGRAARYHDVKRNPQCYVLLCRYPCHALLLDGNVSLHNLPGIV